MCNTTIRSRAVPCRRRNRVLWSVASAVVALAAGAWAASPAGGTPPRLELTIAPSDWEGPSVETVDRVLRSVARELVCYFPDREIPALVIRPKGGPIACYRRGPGGEICIRLNTGGTYWSQYAYQFSHELCHVLCGYDQDETGNRWFEESVCELASLFVLRQMAARWSESPPYEHWKGYAPHLATYAEKRMEAARLPAGQTLADWYAENASALDGTSTQRALNAVVAVSLLPLFERTPRHWEAIRYLNVGAPETPQTFREYLQDWRDHSPAAHRPFIDRIAREFGLSL